MRLCKAFSAVTPIVLDIVYIYIYTLYNNISIKSGFDNKVKYLAVLDRGALSTFNWMRTTSKATGSAKLFLGVSFEQVRT